MKLELSKAVCRWLRQLGIIEDPVQGTTAIIIDQSEERASVSFDQQIYFENGWLVGRILKHIERDYKLGLKHLGRIRKITVLKEHENWQIIWRALRKIEVKVPEDCEQLVVSEHNTIIAVVLQQIYTRFYEKPPKLKVPEQRISFTAETFQPDKELDEAVSSLELVCLAVGRTFGMEIGQILSLLVDRQRGLAHLIVQGTTTTEFQQVLDLYQLLIDNSEALRELMQRDKQHSWVMNGLRCGLFSNSIQVAGKCIRLMRQLAVSDWLSTVDNMKSIFLGLRRHSELSRSLFDVMVGALGEGFVPYLKNEFQARFAHEQEFLMVAAEMVKYIKFSLYKKEFLESLVVDDWLLLALECLEGDHKSGQVRMRALSLLTEAMMLHDFTRNLRFGSQIKRVFSADQVRHQTLCNGLHFCGCLMRLLCYHAQRKNAQARRYYELLCHVLQATLNEDIREFVLRNLHQLFSKFPKMPLEVFVGAVSEMNFTQPHELHILRHLAGQTDLQAPDAVSLGELALSNYKKILANFQYSDVVVEIVRRFRLKVSEFAYATIRDLLDIYKQLVEKPAAASKRVESLARRAQSKKLSSIFYTQGEQNELIHEKKKSNTIGFIKRLIGVSNKNMGKNIKPWLLSCKRELEKKKLKHPGLQSCIKLIDELLTQPDHELEFSEDVSIIDEEPEEEFYKSRHIPTKREPVPNKSTLLADSEDSDNEFLQPISPLDKSNLQFSKAGKSQVPQAHSQVMSQLSELTPRSAKKSTILSGGLFKSIKKPNEALQEHNDEQPQQSNELQLITTDLLQPHELLFLKNTKDRYQKLFAMLFEEYNKMGLEQFVRYYNLTGLLLADTFGLLKNQLTKHNEGQFTPQLFTEFLVQVAYNSFPATGKMVEADCLERLVRYLEQQRHRHGQSTLLFEDIDQVYYSKSEKVRQLTDQLRKDSSLVLPQDYKAHIIRSTSYSNNLSVSKLKLPEKFVIAYEILSDLFEKVTQGFQLIEPVLIMENKLTVRPNVYTNLQHQSPTKQPIKEPTTVITEVKQPIKNKLRTILNANKLDPSVTISPKGQSGHSRSPGGSTVIQHGFGSPANTHVANTPTNMQQPSAKISMVELNRKRVEKLALRRKILESDMRAMANSGDLSSSSQVRQAVDMPTQVTESNLQDKPNNESPQKISDASY